MRVLGYVLVKETELLELRNGKEEEARAAAARADACAALRAHLATAREGQHVAVSRAMFAEGIIRMQTASIEQLMASNERMAKLVGDMRRSGFGILEPIETRDTPATVDEADRDAVEEDPDLEADPE